MEKEEEEGQKGSPSPGREGERRRIVPPFEARNSDSPPPPTYCSVYGTRGKEKRGARPRCGVVPPSPHTCRLRCSALPPPPTVQTYSHNNTSPNWYSVSRARPPSPSSFHDLRLPKERPQRANEHEIEEAFVACTYCTERWGCKMKKLGAVETAATTGLQIMYSNLARAVGDKAGEEREVSAGNQFSGSSSSLTVVVVAAATVARTDSRIGEKGVEDLESPSLASPSSSPRQGEKGFSSLPHSSSQSFFVRK